MSETAASTQSARATWPAAVSAGRSRDASSSALLPWQMLPLLLGAVFLIAVDPALIRVHSDDPLVLPLLGNTIRRAVLGAAYVAALAGALAQPGLLRRLAARQIPMLVLLAYAFASVLWSSAPSVTIVRALHFAGMLLLANCALETPEAPRRIVAVWRWVLLAGLLASVAWIAAFPADAMSPDTGAWAGIYQHKSDLGGVAVLALAAWLPSLGADRGPVRRVIAVFTIALALVLMWQSDSATERIGTVAVIGLWVLAHVQLPWSVKLPLVPIPPLLGIFWYVNQGKSFDTLLQGILGRDITLTGRTPLWDAILQNVSLHPWLGEGYDAFWVAGNARAEYLVESVGWEAYHAHNGYLEVLNALGIVGMLIFLATLAHAIFCACRYFVKQPRHGLVFPSILLWLVISSTTKSVFCQGTTIGWFAFLVIYAVVAANGAAGGTATRTRPPS